MDVRFFKTPAELRKWFEKNHETIGEQWIGFYKKGSGQPSITWPESVDQALCFGWIDGLRKSIDDKSYKIRFTPRKAKSIWSAVNIRRAGELIGMGMMHSAGIAAFERREEDLSRKYAYEQETVALGEEFLERFKRSPAAWRFFESQSGYYRKVASHWVTSAKQAVTRERRLVTLIEDSANGLRIAGLRPEKK
jgi:uncharacterized protein YdeI (YjbR/CyaY-like superfamily)